MPPFSARALARKIRRALRDLVFYRQWYLMLGIGDELEARFAEFRSIIPPPHTSWADPFVVYRDGAYYLFVEEIPPGTRKGHISRIQVDGDRRCHPPVRVLERPYHLSYPFVFEWQQELFMVPESAAAGRIDAYRCTGFPDQWTHHACLMSDVRAVDATLVPFQGRWWLFAGMPLRRNGPANEALFLYHSADPLSASWAPHPQNPIVHDPRRARPAGRIFARNGMLYRPSQDCSERYGSGLRISRITCLDVGEYAEEEVRFVEPDWDPRVGGVHTLNRAGGLTAIDAKFRGWRWEAKRDRATRARGGEDPGLAARPSSR